MTEQRQTPTVIYPADRTDANGMEAMRHMTEQTAPGTVEQLVDEAIRGKHLDHDARQRARVHDAQDAERALAAADAADWVGAEILSLNDELAAHLGGRQSCQECNGPHILDTSLPSATWNKIADPSDYLCALCIDKRLVKTGLTCDQAEFYFVGEALSSKLYAESHGDVQAVGRELAALRQSHAALVAALLKIVPLGDNSPCWAIDCTEADADGMRDLCLVHVAGVIARAAIADAEKVTL